MRPPSSGAPPVVEPRGREVRVLLADDHAVVRAGIRALVDAQPGLHVVGEAADGEDALRQAEALQPDVLVMDMSMPRLNGAQAARLVRERCPAVRVLALTVHEERGYVLQLLKAGASGYVLKRAAGDELIHAIWTVADGHVYLDPQVAMKVVDGALGDGSSDVGHRSSETLSAREADVLRLVAEGYSNKEIAAKLAISVRTVETYKARLMEKLGLRSRTDLVRYALQEGWLSA